MPEISVIVPVYNVEAYLSRCIDSVLSQTFRDFELILVDDGSTDGSPALCDWYAEQDSRVRVYHKENGGQSSARNVGVRYAEGEFIAFVDSDDWCSPYMLSYLHFLARSYSCDVVSASYVLSDGADADFGGAYTETVVEGTDKILGFYLSQDKLGSKNDYSVWAKLYKRTLFAHVEFPEGKIYEDIIFNFKVLRHCSRYVKSTRSIYAYFQRQQSTTKMALTKKHIALIDVAKEIEILAGCDAEIRLLAVRKQAMAYFSLLAMYVRYGTDLLDEDIVMLVANYKKIKHFYLRTEKSIKIHIISCLLCLSVKTCRKMYVKLKRRSKYMHKNIRIIKKRGGGVNY